MFVQADIDTTSPIVRSAVSFEYWFTDRDASPTLVNSKAIRMDKDNESSTNLAMGTVLVSKTTGKYRVQSTVLPALWLVTHELCNRLEERWHADGGVKIKYTEPLPLSDFYIAVDNHHATRIAVRSAESAMNDVCHQFRIIEKRLLVRFKDSRPAAIHRLDTLMQQTHDNLLQLGSIVETAQAERMRCSRMLACSTSLLILLIRFRFSLSSKELVEVSSYLNPDIIAHNTTAHEETLAGWEEITDASLTFMLKVALTRRPSREVSASAAAHTPKHASSILPPPMLTFPLTTEKLKRRIAMMCDRLDH